MSKTHSIHWYKQTSVTYFHFIHEKYEKTLKFTQADLTLKRITNKLHGYALKAGHHDSPRVPTNALLS